MMLRNYHPDDCPVLARLFYETVHTVNARDYSREQLDAWATGDVDLAKWNESFLGTHTVVAKAGCQIVGFGNMDFTGYLERCDLNSEYTQHRLAHADKHGR